MDPIVSAFAQFIGLNDHLIGKALDGLTEEEAWRLPGADSNPVIWIAGHVAASRSALVGALGGGVDLPWAARFGQKTQPDQAAGGPSLGEIRAAIATLTERLMERLAALTDADLARAAPRSFPIPDRTVRGMIVFLVYHESYHVGQLAYLRKWLGYPGVVDGQ